MIMVTTQQYALMALEAYYDSPHTITVDGQLFEAKYSSADYSMELNNSGFFATSYEIGTEIVIAFRGSNSPGSDLPDWLSNAGWSTYTQDPPLLLLDAWNYYQLVKAENPTATISFAGHSLGGGLAGAMAALVGGEAEMFAPAPFEGTINQLIESGGHTYRYVTGGPN